MRDEVLTFERGFDPTHPERSAVQCRVLGYGEISTIIEIESLPGWALKRLPVFDSEQTAKAYETSYRDYCSHLSKAGLILPHDATEIIPPSGNARPWCLYIAQEAIRAEDFVHRRLEALPRGKEGASEAQRLASLVADALEKVWEYTDRNRHIELALDGQFSNWVLKEGELLYIDTGTPLYRVDGVEQLQPEPLLSAAPPYLRWILRAFFLEDVMGRYYHIRNVCMDVAANLHKEGRPDLLEPVLESLNGQLAHRFGQEGELSVAQVNAYYREDKLIWTLFLAFRRFDRTMRKLLPVPRYEFLLPGPIKR